MTTRFGVSTCEEHKVYDTDPCPLCRIAELESFARRMIEDHCQIMWDRLGYSIEAVEKYRHDRLKEIQEVAPDGE